MSNNIVKMDGEIIEGHYSVVMEKCKKGLSSINPAFKDAAIGGLVGYGAFTYGNTEIAALFAGISGLLIATTFGDKDEDGAEREATAEDRKMARVGPASLMLVVLLSVLDAKQDENAYNNAMHTCKVSYETITEHGMTKAYSNAQNCAEGRLPEGNILKPMIRDFNVALKQCDPRGSIGNAPMSEGRYKALDACLTTEIRSNATSLWGNPVKDQFLKDIKRFDLIDYKGTNAPTP